MNHHPRAFKQVVEPFPIGRYKIGIGLDERCIGHLLGQRAERGRPELEVAQRDADDHRYQKYLRKRQEEHYGTAVRLAGPFHEPQARQE